MDEGIKLLVALVESGDVLQYHKLHLSEKLFAGNELEVFQFVESHVQKYRALPKPETLAEFGDFAAAPEPSEYYSDQVRERFAHRRINKTLVDCSELMKGQDHWSALNLIQELVVEVRATQAEKSLIEFTKDGYSMYMAEYVKKQKQELMGIQMGWPYLDTKSGGLRGGDVLSIVGRPAMGKTWSVLYSARHVAVQQGLTALMVTTEMTSPLVIERLVAMDAELPMSHVHKGELSTTQMKRLEIAGIACKQHKGRLWVLDTNFASTVQEILAVVSFLNPHVLFIDGAYLVKHKDARLDKHKRADVNIEMIKQGVTEFDIPAVLSYQFNRDAQKKLNKGQDVGLEDIAHSDNIGMASSVALGMFEDESVETMHSRKIQVLKGRHGEIGSFKINWDFMKMDFSEYDEKAQTMQFI